MRSFALTARARRNPTRTADPGRPR